MRIAIAMIVAGMMLAGASAWAGSACCSASKGKAKDMSACMQAISGLTLSDEQKAKIAEIEAACQAEGSTAEACGKARDQIRALLSDDQKAEFDAKWDKKAAKSGSCG